MICDDGFKLTKELINRLVFWSSDSQPGGWAPLTCHKINLQGCKITVWTEKEKT